MDVTPTPIPANSHLCPRRSEGGIADTDHDTWRDNGTCSYCGSYNPDVLMAELESGEVTIGPTDKSYKAYLTYPQPDRHGKFYFQHLSEAQMIRFVELHNANALKLSYPHHFYVLPFFMKREPATGQAETKAQE